MQLRKQLVMRNTQGKIGLTASKLIKASHNNACPQSPRVRKVFADTKKLAQHELRRIHDKYMVENGALHLQQLADNNDKCLYSKLKTVIGSIQSCSMHLCNEDGQLMSGKVEFLHVGTLTSSLYLIETISDHNDICVTS